MKILYAITHHTSAQNFLRGQLNYLSSKGIEVHLTSGPGPGLRAISDSDSPIVHEIPIERDISPIRDLGTLWSYLRLIKRIRPDVVNGSTPKAALLSMIAARMLRIPRRVYVVRGLRGSTTDGLKRRLLDWMERLTCWGATDVIAVSHSLRAEYLDNRLHAGKTVRVLGDGSSNGVDPTKFKPATIEERTLIRREWGIDPHEIVFAYVGRLNADKGIPFLLRAIEQLAPTAPITVVMQGEVEDLAIRDALAANPVNTLHFPWGDTRRTLAAADALVLPTLREGFPNVVLEAACMGLPAISTTATGACDAVVDKVTGVLVPPMDISALAGAMEQLAKDGDLRHRLGCQARERALKDFRQTQIWRSLHDFYVGSEP